MAEISTLRRRSRKEDALYKDNVELKRPYNVSESADQVPGGPPAYAYDSIWRDTPNDLRDMQRLGKKQEFKRNFSFLAALGFVSIYMATWEFVLVSLSVGLYNGGFAGLFWTFIGTVICYSTIVASLAEMESMAPTSGGQYHWVSEFAPPEWQKFLSYASGWMSTLGWLASVASSTFVVTKLDSANHVFRFHRGMYPILWLLLEPNLQEQSKMCFNTTNPLIEPDYGLSRGKLTRNSAEPKSKL